MEKSATPKTKKEIKELQEKKAKALKRVSFFLVLSLVLGLGIFSIFVPTQTWVYYFNKPKLAPRQAGELRVHFLDVGQADSTLIEFPDGKIMLIDGGDETSDLKIMRYLNALKVDKLDYVLLTHTDSDHCGALDVVVREKDVGTVILPRLNGDETAKRGSFFDFSQELSNSDAKTEIASRYLSISSSNELYPYVFTVLYPYSEEAEGDTENNSNEGSTICWLDYRGTSVLLCGDTNATTLELLMRETSFGVFEEFGVDLTSTEIIKIPHHGASDGLSERVLSCFNADTGILSCGKNNYYGHPSADTLKLLNDANVNLYRTDWQGDVHLSVKTSGERNFTTENNKP